MLAKNPHRGRAIAGAFLYVTLMAVGAAILVYFFVYQPLATAGRQFDARLDAMEIGAICAFPPLALYLFLPWIIDRFDPEPWWTLALVLLWGGVAAAGFSGIINTAAVEVAQSIAGGGRAAAEFGDTIGACVSAPLVEEFWKGLAILGIFVFLRREFDGVVDGIIYGTFVALGFAATENVTYYSRAALVQTVGHQEGALVTAFVLRGILSPWGHPLYTSMTGIGFGVARETDKTWLKWMAPLFGYAFAVFLHALWNGAATYSGMLVMLMLPLWLLFVLAFLGIICWLVARKGRIIRENLRDEVLIGSLSQQELDLICSPIGRLRATFGHGGSIGRSFVAHGARLGLCKWHAARAMKGKKETISVGFIAPLRQEMARLRYEMWQRTGRAPARPAYPGAGQPRGWQQQQPPPGWTPPPGGPRR